MKEAMHVHKSRISYGWVVVATGFTIILVGYAVRNTFTVFYPVIVDDFGWTRGITAIMYSLTMLSYGLVAPFAGSLVDRFSPKLVFSAGGLVIGGGIALCSTATSVWHFYLFYGVMVAAGLSLIGFTPLSSLITHWFSGKKAMVFGLLGAGFGVSLVSAPLFQWLISEYGWRMAYVITGVSAAVLVAPLALIFLKHSPEQSQMVADHKAKQALSAGAESISESLQIAEWSVRSALKTRSYWLLLLMSFCNMGFAQGVTVAHQVYFLRDVGYAPMTAASIFSAFGIAFVAGNLSSGLSDRLGRTRVFTPGCLLAAAAFTLLYFADATTPVAVALIFAIATGYGLGITPPTCFAGIADCFHGRNYGSIQGTAILAVAFGAAIGPWLGGFLHDLTGSYMITFALVQVGLVVAAVLMPAVRPPQREHVH